jgi:hypothetical protein
MPAPAVDRAALEHIHEALEAKGLLPDTHLVDVCHVDADQLVTSRNKGVTLLGPAPKRLLLGDSPGSTII